MDLFLLDMLLKGKIPETGKVLDVGCGEGRNGFYFIKQGYHYHGLDRDRSKVLMLEYVAKALRKSHARFYTADLCDHEFPKEHYHIIICSRLLHFASSEKQLLQWWQKLADALEKGGALYLSMDTIVGTQIAKAIGDGIFVFPDGKERMVLTDALFSQMKKGFEVLEPLQTMVRVEERAQSFVLLKKK